MSSSSSSSSDAKAEPAPVVVRQRGAEAQEAADAAAIAAKGGTLGGEFAVDELVLAFHGKCVYAAKVLRVMPQKGENPLYYLHYQGWNRKCVLKAGATLPPAAARRRPAPGAAHASS